MFCEVNHADHARLLLYTVVRWLLKENFLRRFMELFEPLGELLKDNSKVLFLMTTDCKAHVSYLKDIFKTLFFKQTAPRSRCTTLRCKSKDI